jgi:hypothetical protein
VLPAAVGGLEPRHLVLSTHAGCCRHARYARYAGARTTSAFIISIRLHDGCGGEGSSVAIAKPQGSPLSTPA